METVLGVEGVVHKKFLDQCRRWSRTTWRSNLCSLFTDRSVWAYQPYSVYAIYLTPLTNFAAVVDPLLIYLFTHTSTYVSFWPLCWLASWILFTKAKVFAYFWQHPQDVWVFQTTCCSLTFTASSSSGPCSRSGIVNGAGANWAASRSTLPRPRTNRDPSNVRVKLMACSLLLVPT